MHDYEDNTGARVFLQSFAQSLPLVRSLFASAYGQSNKTCKRLRIG